MDDHLDAIGEVLVEATRQVFESAGVSLVEAAKCDPVGEWLDPIAVLGFGGEVVRGSVSLEVPWRLLQACHPVRSSAPDDLLDWAGELSNLVVAGLKTSLRQRGVAIQPGLPVTFTMRAAHTGGTGASQLQYRLRSPDGAVLVRFAAQVDPAFNWGPPRSAEIVHDIELF